MKIDKLLKILFIGDIVGKPGRRAAKLFLAENKKKYDLVFANGENLASGHGMVMTKYDEMTEAGIDYFTSGNHIWDKPDFEPALDDENIHVLRPLNYPETKPGRGMAEISVGDSKIVLINLLGRVFIKDELRDPFAVVNEIVSHHSDKIIVIDLHAEATSEKIAMKFYLDGRIAALVGTHTHVQTADEEITPKGTAYITDLGMCGPTNSVLGVEKDTIIKQFLTGENQSHKVATGEVNFSAVEINIDRESKKATSIRRISQKYAAN
ncbi:MAG: TIGR00282 family metallophosphoesterase [Candidatus Berkelbacteria bacterium]